MTSEEEFVTARRRERRLLKLQARADTAAWLARDHRRHLDSESQPESRSYHRAQANAYQAHSAELYALVRTLRDA